MNLAETKKPGANSIRQLMENYRPLAEAG